MSWGSCSFTNGVIVKREDRNLVLILAALLALFMPAAASFGADGTTDPVAQARQLAFSGKEHRGEALTMLQARLSEDPTDSDARVLYGIVLSWEGRYNESRDELKQVLAASPDHGDALAALINVELWSGNPGSAELVARGALTRNPNNAGLLLADARALYRMRHNREAIEVLNRLLLLDKNNEEGRKLRREITMTSLTREFSYFQTYDWFSDGRNSQSESNFELKTPTPFGSLIGILNRGDRFSEIDYQTEADFYPRIRPGTYGYLAIGHGVHGTLYPTFNVAADLFQTIPHGFEASGGYRHLEFSTGVDIYTFALAKYHHNWLFTGRGFIVPGNPGTSGTGLLSARYFLGSEGLHDYVEFRYSRGASPALAYTITDVQILASSTYGVVLDKQLANRWYTYVNAHLSQDQRTNQADLREYEVQGGFYFKF